MSLELFREWHDRPISRERRKVRNRLILEARQQGIHALVISKLFDVSLARISDVSRLARAHGIQVPTAERRNRVVGDPLQHGCAQPYTYDGEPSEHGFCDDCGGCLECFACECVG